MTKFNIYDSLVSNKIQLELPSKKFKAGFEKTIHPAINVA